jgi:hypothetical protein
MELLTNIEDDFSEIEYAIASRASRIAICATPEEAAAFYYEGQQLERKLRVARAHICGQRDELYQTGFLLRAFSADLPVGERSGVRLDIQA